MRWKTEKVRIKARAVMRGIFFFGGLYGVGGGWVLGGEWEQSLSSSSDPGEITYDIASA